VPSAVRRAFVAFFIAGTVLPIILLFIGRRALLSPYLILSLWPSSIFLIADTPGVGGWIAGIVSILVNGLA